MVRQVGAKFLIVDGHHRFAAYDAELVFEPVPVVHLEGDLREAIKVAIRSNAKAKLNMTEEDKLNAAWRMTCMNSRKATRLWRPAKTCDIGTTTVTNMRAVRDRLNADDGWVLGRTGTSWTWRREIKTVGRGTPQGQGTRAASELKRRWTSPRGA